MPAALARWDPFAELGDLRSRFDRLLAGVGDGGTWTPAMDVIRDNGNLVLRADIPGFKPEDVKIEIEDGMLTMTGEHEEHIEDENKGYLRRERRYGSFYRSMALPADVAAEKVVAKTHDGVLEVTIPLPEKAAKHAVEIKPAAV
jgi:HSP20 family protein